MSPPTLEPLAIEPANNFGANCRQYLHQLSAMGALVGDFYLLLGRAYAASPLPKGVVLGVPRQCYGNAGTLAVERGWTYCEGFAMRPGLFPMHHAWCLDEDGQVVDPTWPYDPLNEYLGVALGERFLVDTCDRTGYWGIFSHQLPPDVVRAPPDTYLHPRWTPSKERQTEFLELISRQFKRDHT